MRTWITAVLLLLASYAGAQSATLTTPEAGVTATKIVVTDFRVGPCNGGAPCAQVTISYQDAGSSEKRQATFGSLPPVPFLAALTTVRSGETGTLVRKLNFRILGFLIDQNELTQVTLVP